MQQRIVRQGRKVFVPTLFIVVLIPLIFTAAQDDTAHEAQSKILAVENAWNLAEAKGDIKALSLIFDDFMIYVDEDGSMLTKGEFLARARAAGAHPQSLATQSMDAQVYGDTAIVTGIYRFKGVEHGQSIQRDGRFSDIWVRRNGTWVCVAAQATPILR